MVEVTTITLILSFVVVTVLFQLIFMFQERLKTVQSRLNHVQ
jgi:hypothetical protein